MDWDTLHVGLRTWVAIVANVSIHDVAWDGEPIGARNFPQADLVLTQPAAEGTDEVRLDVAPDGTLVERIVGSRLITLTITLRTRDQYGAARAYVTLDGVRTKLVSEFTATAFDALGVVAREAGAIQRSQAPDVVDQRELSVASLSIALGYTVCELGDLTPAMQPLEHVVVGGTVAPIGEIPEHVIP